MNYIIVHGSFGSPSENWFPYLKTKLIKIGQIVEVPALPVDNWDTVTKNGQDFPVKNQSLTSWLKIFQEHIVLNPKEKYCFVGHSLAPLFILHLIDKLNIQLDSAIFVCPFLTHLNTDWQIDLANASFYKSDFNFIKLKKLIPLNYVVYSNNDPYVDVKYALEFSEKMGSAKICITNGGHLGTSAGFAEFPLLFELCKTRLNPTIYQHI
jgi:uncharacterized protein